MHTVEYLFYVQNRGQGKHVVLFKTPKIKINVTNCIAIEIVNYTIFSELDAIHVHLCALCFKCSISSVNRKCPLTK